MIGFELRGGKLPTRATPDSVGLDLYLPHDVSIPPHEFVPVDLGIWLSEAPPSTELAICHRSRAFRRHVYVFPGIIEPDYRGPIILGLGNFTDYRIGLKEGESFAQLVVRPVLLVQAEERPISDTTLRGARGGIRGESNAVSTV